MGFTQQKSPMLKDAELEKLLTEILEQALGQKIPENEKALIIGIAKEMIKDAKPEGLSRRDMKSTDSKEFLKNTLTAATSVALLMTQKKDDIHNLLDRHKQLTLELKGLKPGKENDEKRNALTKELNGVKDELKKALKYVNKFDNCKPRRDAMDKLLDKDDFFDHLDEVRNLTDSMKNDLANGTTTPQQDASLGNALSNLYGMDPRVAGSVASPVMSVVGNEFGIPDSSPAYSAGEPLHVMSEDYFTSGADSQHKSILDSMEGSEASYEEEARDTLGSAGSDILDSFSKGFEAAADSVMENNNEMLNTSPRPTPK
jgi:hypothetical protein